MDALEKISEQKKCMFVDLFVRVSNAVAITMYRVSEPYPLMCSIRSLPILKFIIVITKLMNNHLVGFGLRGISNGLTVL